MKLKVILSYSGTHGVHDRDERQANFLSAISAVIPGGPSMDKIRRPVRLKQVLRIFWRNHVADECPDEKERIRRERINNIMQNVVLLEAMRRWEVETRGH